MAREAPNDKHQAPGSSQRPNTNSRTTVGRLKFGAFCFTGACELESAFYEINDRVGRFTGHSPTLLIAAGFFMD